MKLGTLFVLIGAILFAVALVFHARPMRRQTFYTDASFFLALAGLFTAVGVLLGAPALHAVK